MKAPFPYAGGKSKIAPIVWERFGDVPNYVEPFFGSGAVLLARPDEHDWRQRVETVNDADGLLCNFWRAVQADPDAVAEYADWPVNENDLHARHYWLVQQKVSLRAKLEGDPNYYCARAAGWWVWGIGTWIGSGWCNTRGPWVAIDGELVKRERGRRETAEDPEGVCRKLPHLGGDRGVHRKTLTAGDPEGVCRQLPHLGDNGRGVHRKTINIYELMQELSDRLRRVRVCCGDWSRVTGPTPTTKHGVTGMFLDPPYAHSERCNDLYCVETDCAQDVLQWCLAHGDDPKLRICLCGYDGEHNVLEEHGWSVVAWKAAGGYGSQGNGRARENAHRERLWFSPHCLHQDAGTFTLAIEGGIL